MQHFSNGLANAVHRKNTVILLLPEVLLLHGTLCSVGHACKAARSVQQRSDTGEKRGARAENQRSLFLTVWLGMWVSSPSQVINF